MRNLIVITSAFFLATHCSAPRENVGIDTQVASAQVTPEMIEEMDEAWDTTNSCGHILTSLNGIAVRQNGPKLPVLWGKCDPNDTPYGYKWHCVEFVYRYIEKAIAFRSSTRVRLPRNIGSAKNLKDRIRAELSNQFEIIEPSAISSRGALMGDILIFGASGNNTHGHVAIIGGMQNGMIEYYDQNSTMAGKGRLSLGNLSLAGMPVTGIARYRHGQSAPMFFGSFNGGNTDTNQQTDQGNTQTEEEQGSDEQEENTPVPPQTTNPIPHPHGTASIDSNHFCEQHYASVKIEGSAAKKENGSIIVDFSAFLDAKAKGKEGDDLPSISMRAHGDALDDAGRRIDHAHLKIKEVFLNSAVPYVEAEWMGASGSYAGDAAKVVTPLRCLRCEIKSGQSSCE